MNKCLGASKLGAFLSLNKNMLITCKNKKVNELKLLASCEHVVLAAFILYTFLFPFANFILKFDGLPLVTFVGRALFILALIGFMFKVKKFYSSRQKQHGEITKNENVILFLSCSCRLALLGAALTVILMILAAASLLWTVNFTLSEIYLFQTLSSYAYFIIALVYIDNIRKLYYMAYAYILGNLVNSLGIIVNYALGDSYLGNMRYSAFGLNPNDISFSIVFALALIPFVYGFFTARFLKLTNLLMIGFFTFAIYLTCSRTIYMAFVLLMPLLLRFGYCIFKQQKLPLVFIVAATVIAMFVFVPEYISNNSISRSAETAYSNTASIATLDNRVPIWQAGWKAFMEKPVLGYGFGSYEVVMNKFLGTNINAHNIFIQLLVELGAIGGIIIIGFLIQLILFGQSMNWQLQLFYFTLIILWLLVVCLGNYVASKTTWFLFAFAFLFYNHNQKNSYLELCGARQ